MRKITLLFVLGLLLVAKWAQAANVIENRISLDDSGLLYRLYDDGTAVVVNNPPNPPFERDSVFIPASVAYKGQSYTVTGIGFMAFYESPVVNISGGENITFIEASAFEGCTQLKGEWTLEGAVTSVGNYAFQGCNNPELELRFANFADATIGVSAFMDCVGLRAVAGTAASLDFNSFKNCSGLTSIGNLLKYVTVLPECAFEGCSSLEGEIVLEGAITSISAGVFRGCTQPGLRISINNLSNVDIPFQAFKECTGLRRVAGTAKSIGSGAFYGCSGLTSIGNLLKDFTYIPDYCFLECTSLTGEITLEGAVTVIGMGAFYQCTDPNLSLHVTNLTDAMILPLAFNGCTGLKTVDGTVKSIGDGAFSECTGLTSIGHILEKVTEVPNGAFHRCSSLSGEVALNGAVTYVGNYAFAECTSEQLVISVNNLSDAVLGYGAFAFCKNLKNLAGTVTQWDQQNQCAFYACSNLPYVDHLFSNATEIPKATFYGGSSLSGAFTLGPAVTAVGEVAFGNNSISSIYSLAAVPPTLGADCFQSTTNYTVKVPFHSVDSYRAAWGDAYQMEISAGDPSAASTVANSGSATRWATFSNTFSDSQLSVESGQTLTLYNATVANGELTLTERTGCMVAKGEAVLVRTDAASVSVTPLPTTDLVPAQDNDLVATPEYATVMPSRPGYRLYRLTFDNVEDRTALGFYLGMVKDDSGNVVCQDGSQLRTMPGRACLMVSAEMATKPASATPVRGFAFPDDDTTGMGELVIEGDSFAGDGADGGHRTYNLGGQQVGTPKKGVYIKNHRKVVFN